jgi:hypothetical protein
VAIRPPARRPIPVPSRLPIPAADWHALVSTRANTVIVASENATMMVLTAVWPTLKKPIHWVEADRLSLPRQSAGTLIVQGADALSASAQQQLFDWLERDTHATRILTTTERPLFPLVEAGSFLTPLYFRLNVLLLVL